MDAVGVLGRPPPCTVSSDQRRNGLMRFQHLSALQASSSLSVALGPCIHGGAMQVAMPRRRAKAHIFLPHLVAAMEQVEETYVMVKPDGVQRGLVGEIISRFEKKGFLLKGLKLFQCPKELAEVGPTNDNIAGEQWSRVAIPRHSISAEPRRLSTSREARGSSSFREEHYKDLKEKSFYPKLIDYITSGPVVCMAWEGVGVVASARKLIGATNPLQAEPGTIRGDLAVETGRNVVHGSDSPENGQREVALWFKEGELCQWAQAQAPWLRE